MCVARGHREILHEGRRASEEYRTVMGKEGAGLNEHTRGREMQWGGEVKEEEGEEEEEEEGSGHLTVTRTQA